MTARIPQSNLAAYKAAALIHEAGTIPRTELFTRVHFSNNTSNRNQILGRAIESGWLIETPDGVTLGADAKANFESLEQPSKPKYIGQIATSRASNAYDRPPLSKRFIPNSRGTRDDVPAFSLRSGVSFYTQA